MLVIKKLDDETSRVEVFFRSVDQESNSVTTRLTRTLETMDDLWALLGAIQLRIPDQGVIFKRGFQPNNGDLPCGA